MSSILDLPSGEISMDSTYSKLEEMIRNCNREKMSNQSRIESLQQEIEALNQHIKERDADLGKLRLEKGRYEAVHEEDEKGRFHVEAMVLNCEKKLQLLVKSVHSFESNLEDTNETYAHLMEFNQIVKQKQSQLNDLLKEEQNKFENASMKLSQYESELVKLQIALNQQVEEKTKMESDFIQKNEGLQLRCQQLQETMSEAEKEYTKKKAEFLAEEANLKKCLENESLELNQLKSKLDDSNEQICFITKKIEDISNQKTQIENELTLQIQKLEEVAQKEKLLHEEHISELKATYNKLAEEKTKMDLDWTQRYDELQLKYQNSQDTIYELEKTFKEKIDAYELEGANFKLCLETATLEINQLKAQVEDSNAKNCSLSKQIEDMSEEKAKMETGFEAEIQRMKDIAADEKVTTEKNMAELEATYNKLAEDKTKMELDWTQRYDELQLRCQQLQDLMSEAEKSHKEKVDCFESEGANNRERLEVASTENSDLKSKLADTTEQNYILGKKIEEMLEQKVQIETQLSLEIEKLKDIAQEERTVNDKKVSELESSCAKMAEEKAQMEADWGQRNEDLQLKCNQFEESIIEAEKSYKEKFENLESEVESLKLALSDSSVELDEIKLKLDQSQDRIVQLEKEHQELAEEKENREAELQDELKAAKETIKQHFMNGEKKNETIRSLTRRFEEMKNMINKVPVVKGKAEAAIIAPVRAKKHTSTKESNPVVDEDHTSQEKNIGVSKEKSKTESSQKLESSSSLKYHRTSASIVPKIANISPKKGLADLHASAPEDRELRERKVKFYDIPSSQSSSSDGEFSSMIKKRTNGILTASTPIKRPAPPANNENDMSSSVPAEKKRKEDSSVKTPRFFSSNPKLRPILQTKSPRKSY